MRGVSNGCGENVSVLDNVTSLFNSGKIGNSELA